MLTVMLYYGSITNNNGHYMKWFYEKNDELINSEVNKTFEEVLWMNETDFSNWVAQLRNLVVKLWDEKGIPPRVGFDEDGMIDNFRKMLSFPVHKFEVQDLDTGDMNIIRNTSVIGNAVNQFFPTMMKTKITTSNNAERSKSIYDWFKDKELYDRFRKYAYRNLKRDSFYHYSNPIAYDQICEFGNKTYRIDSAEGFVEWFESNNVRDQGWDYFIAPVKSDYEYTGYNSNLKTRQNIVLNELEIGDLRAGEMFDGVGLHRKNGIPDKCLTCVDFVTQSPYLGIDPKKLYQIRIFKYGQKLFPIGLKAFKVTFSQYAVNFPPLTAKYLWQRYTKHITDQKLIKLYDPSAGWGGRLLGALSLNISKKYLYIGTDPNTDHDTTPGRTKYHEITDFFNGNIRENNNLFSVSQEVEIYQLGSEVIRNDPGFQKHKGTIDMVFTSPPYFSKEVYSDDPNQSCHKFGDYEAWRDGFLRPTLETAVEWLRSDRYLLWNIADIQVGNKMLPLEEDSRKILESLGMEYVETIKMALAAMPGSNRFEEDGETEETVSNLLGDSIVKKPILKGKMKNFCRIKAVNGKETMLKYEPIFVWRKP